MYARAFNTVLIHFCAVFFNLMVRPLLYRNDNFSFSQLLRFYFFYTNLIGIILAHFFWNAFLGFYLWLFFFIAYNIRKIYACLRGIIRQKMFFFFSDRLIYINCFWHFFCALTIFNALFFYAGNEMQNFWEQCKIFFFFFIFTPCRIDKLTDFINDRSIINSGYISYKKK